MKLIVCVDKSNGMLFNNRRQSQDRVLREKLLSLVGERRLFLNAYSARQFENSEKLSVCEDFLAMAGEDDFCFVENVEIPADKVDEIYLFQWNRDYPADVYFSLDLNSDYKKIKTEDFAGYSHEKITLEIYQKRS
ncbi:MAG: ribonuclease Z [Ruminiclostridium sp.]|nr:ribonuclease Z [Ruminiclostridium sp.]